MGSTRHSDTLKPASPEERERRTREITLDAVKNALEQGRKDRDALEASQRHEFPDPRIRFR